MDLAVPNSWRWLSVGLAVQSPAWVSLLDSQGLAHGPIGADPQQDVRREVLVGPGGGDERLVEQCKQMARRGATAIMERGTIAETELSDRETWPMPYHRDDFRGLTDADDPAAVRVVRGTFGAGTVFILPFHLGDLWADWRWDKRHVAIGPGQTIFEKMATVVKKNVRRVVVDVLRRAFCRRGLPFVHKWYWPGRNRSVFCFRGDADGGPRRNMEQFLDVAKDFAHCTSLFFCTGKYRAKTDLIAAAAAAGLEIGSHNHWHIVFPDRPTNAMSLSRAERMLASCGCRPRGFVAPAYFWHPTLYRLLEERGYKHASCFRIDHDNIPYYPTVQGHVGHVLEIPFHCLGDRFVGFGIPLDSARTRDFFAGLIRKKYAAGEPLALYGHPDVAGRMGATSRLVRFIMETALSHSDVWATQLGSLADWWRERAEFAWDPWYDPGRGGLVSKSAPRPARASHQLTISIERGGKWYLEPASAASRTARPISACRAMSRLRPSAPQALGEVVFTRDSRPPSGLGRRELKRFLKAYYRAYLSDPRQGPFDRERPFASEGSQGSHGKAERPVVIGEAG